VEFDLTPEHELTQVLLGPLAECLGFFRRVNPTKPDSEEFVAGHERLYSVAVDYADDSSGDGRFLAESVRLPAIDRETPPAPPLARLIDVVVSRTDPSKALLATHRKDRGLRTKLYQSCPTRCGGQ
jgi:hypothetical protein